MVIARVPFVPGHPVVAGMQVGQKLISCPRPASVRKSRPDFYSGHYPGGIVRLKLAVALGIIAGLAACSESPTSPEQSVVELAPSFTREDNPPPPPVDLEAVITLISMSEGFRQSSAQANEDPLIFVVNATYNINRRGTSGWLRFRGSRGGGDDDDHHGDDEDDDHHGEASDDDQSGSSSRRDGDVRVFSSAQVKFSDGVFTGNGRVRIKQGGHILVFRLAEVSQSSQFDRCGPPEAEGQVNCFNIVIEDAEVRAIGTPAGSGTPVNVLIQHDCVSNDPRPACSGVEGLQ